MKSEKKENRREQPSRSCALRDRKGTCYGRARIEAGIRQAFGAAGNGFKCVEIEKLKAAIGLRDSAEERCFAEVIRYLTTRGGRLSSSGEALCMVLPDSAPPA